MLKKDKIINEIISEIAAAEKVNERVVYKIIDFQSKQTRKIIDESFSFNETTLEHNTKYTKIKLFAFLNIRIAKDSYISKIKESYEKRKREKNEQSSSDEFEMDS